MDYRSSKYKLPRGESYPLKRTGLDQALEGLPEGSIRSVGYMRPQAADLVLRAIFSGEAKPFLAAGTTSIYIFAVASTGRKKIEDELLRSGLARLRKWLEELETRGSSWRAVDRTFELHWRADRLIVRTS